MIRFKAFRSKDNLPVMKSIFNTGTDCFDILFSSDIADTMPPYVPIELSSGKSSSTSTSTIWTDLPVNGIQDPDTYLPVMSLFRFGLC